MSAHLHAIYDGDGEYVGTVELSEIGWRLGCEDDDGRPVHPDCASDTAACGCGCP